MTEDPDLPEQEQASEELAAAEPEIANAGVVFDSGSGPALYVGGNFTSAGGVTAYSIAFRSSRTLPGQR